MFDFRKAVCPVCEAQLIVTLDFKGSETKLDAAPVAGGNWVLSHSNHAEFIGFLPHNGPRYNRHAEPCYDRPATKATTTKKKKGS